jgi:RNA polymerase sigma factor (sigma-70 family)
MIPAKPDSFLVSKVREKDMESIIDWFDQNQKSFYTLGWSYMRNQQDMEEVFHRTIVKVYDELQHFKKDTSFESWATSIFINICRGLSGSNQKRSLQASEETQQKIFHALDQLEERDKEAIVLTYLKECPLDEVADILQLPVSIVKSRLFSGIQSLREEMGYHTYLESCKEYHKHYIDYLGRTLDRSKKVEFEIHIYHCRGCHEELSFFQDIMLTLTEVTDAFSVPSSFMERVKGKVVETEKRRQDRKKKCKLMGLAFASTLALIIFTGFITNGFTNIYYSWVDWRNQEDEQLRAFFKSELGERLNMEEVSSGVKVKIKSAIADEVQTLIYYEIEDTNEENRYMMNFYDGIKVENDYEIMNLAAHSVYSPPVEQLELKNEEKNVYRGKISLPPILPDSGTIELKLTHLQKLVQDPESPTGFKTVPYEEMEYIEGNWSFDIPVTKQPSIVHELDKETKVDGIPIRLDKLIIAPTATLLQYSYQNNRADKRIEIINFASLETKGKKVQADLYTGNSFIDTNQNSDWTSLQTSFETLYFEKPKEVNIQFASIHLSIEKHKKIDIDVSKDFPQNFEYLGNNLSIDKVKIGNPTEVVIKNEVTEDRVYESLQFQITSDNDRKKTSMGMSGDGVLIDKNGKQYDVNEYPFSIEKVGQPRFFQTKQSIELFNDASGEQVIPKTLEIQGYNTTKYVDDTVNVSLD